MSSLACILGVARYELVLLWRSTRFRLLGAVGLAVPLLLGILLALLEARGVDFGYEIGASAFLPFYVYSYLQTLVIAFVVGDFRAADERAQVAEVVAARPVATGELVVGKYLGAVGALGLLSLGVLVLAAAIQAAKISLLGSPFRLEPYLVYLGVMTLPALLYMAALTFLLGAVLRLQAAVALTAIAYALGVLFLAGDRFGGLFDFGAFFSPLLYSDLMGFGDLGPVIEQRLLYLALAGLCLSLAVGRYPRLPQSPAWRWGSRAAALTALALALGLGWHLESRPDRLAARRLKLLAEELGVASRPAPEVLERRLRVDLATSRAPLEAAVELRLRNDGTAPLDTLIFTLNPGLALSALRDPAAGDRPWARRGAVVEVPLPSPLAAGAEMSLRFEYAGRVDPEGFDLERTAPRLKKGRWPFSVGDLTTWIRPTSVFLPPRSGWYPTPGVAYGDPPRPRSFAPADIVVTSPADLVVVTQGTPVADSLDHGRALSHWVVSEPVAALSLNAGRYEVFRAPVHGIDCALYLDPAHAHQALFFADAADPVTAALDQLVDALEQETGLAYPYGRLAVVEVPFLVQWYYEGWQETGGLVQPGVLMVEEDAVLARHFQRDYGLMVQRLQGNADPAQLKRDLFVRAVFDTFLRGEGARSGLYRSPVLELWSFDRAFAGERPALLSRGLPLSLQAGASTELASYLFSRGRGGRGGGGMRGGFMGPPGGFGGGPPGARPGATGSEQTPWDTLIVRLQHESLADMDPRAEPGVYRAVFDARSRSLFQVMEAVAGDEGFTRALGDFARQHRYDAVSFADFEAAVLPAAADSTRRASLQGLVHDWLYSTEVPGYTLTRTAVRKLDDGMGSLVYQVIVRIRNGEPGRGFVQVRVSSRQDEVTKGVQINGGEEVEVALVLWERPFRLAVEPFLAKNQRPLAAPLRVPEEIADGDPETYVRVVPPAERYVAEVVVDNEDAGFSMPVRRVQRYLRPSLAGGNWEVTELPFAYGRYETTCRWKEPGDGSQPAVWSAALPDSGEYDVAYYFVPPPFARRFGLNLSGAFSLRVTHGDTADTLAVRADELEGGWNLLGRFRFAAGEEARVELSDRATGRLYADAVRWRYVDPRNPEVAYEEDVASWGSFGRGRGGPGEGPPGGPGGRGPGGPPGGGGSWWQRLF